MSSSCSVSKVKEWSKLADLRQQKTSLIRGLEKTSYKQQQKITAANKMLDDVIGELFDDWTVHALFGSSEAARAIPIETRTAMMNTAISMFDEAKSSVLDMVHSGKLVAPGTRAVSTKAASAGQAPGNEEVESQVAVEPLARQSGSSESLRHDIPASAEITALPTANSSQQAHPRSITPYHTLAQVGSSNNSPDNKSHIPKLKFPTLQEIKDAIPPEGIGRKALFDRFRERFAGRPMSMIKLINSAGTFDKVDQTMKPLRSDVIFAQRLPQPHLCLKRPALLPSESQHSVRTGELDTSSKRSRTEGPSNGASPATRISPPTSSQASAQARSTRNSIAPLRRPTKQNAWYSDETSDDAAWAQVNPSRKRSLSHVGYIEETKAGIFPPRNAFGAAFIERIRTAESEERPAWSTNLRRPKSIPRPRVTIGSPVVTAGLLGRRTAIS